MIFWTNIKFGAYNLDNGGAIEITYDPTMFDSVDLIAQQLNVSKNEIFRRAMIIASAQIEEKLKENISGAILNVRTGYLRNSIGSKVRWDKNGVEGTIGSGIRSGSRMVYANILETGGTIRAKKGKYLTIPIGEQKTKTEKIIGRARDFKNTFIRKGIIFQSLGKGKRENKVRIRPLFLLKESVTIPAFKYMEQTASQTENIIYKCVEQAIEEIISENKKSKQNEQ